MRFDILNRLGVAHECDRQTGRRTDRSQLAILSSQNLKSGLDKEPWIYKP